MVAAAAVVGQGCRTGAGAGRGAVVSDGGVHSGQGGRGVSLRVVVRELRL